MVQCQSKHAPSSTVLSRNPSASCHRVHRGPHQRHFEGLFFDEFDPGSAWIREAGLLQLPALAVRTLSIQGEYLPHPLAEGIEAGSPGLDVVVGRRLVASVRPRQAGAIKLQIDWSEVDSQGRSTVTLRLTGVRLTNFLAWLGRVTGWKRLAHYRAQHKNRQLRIRHVHVQDELLFDFSNRHSPYSTAFARRHLKLGFNLAGYLTADLGIGESARCMVRAADAAQIPVALIDLRLPVKSPRGDNGYAARLTDENPFEVNIVHLDPPGARDLDHHHGAAFRRDKYNIGYWAWELPEFPDAWTPYFDYYDEIWCPSEFVREAVALKSPIPVVTMPHAISFPRPTSSQESLRRRFVLPENRFLFLFLYDLNSYSERKNPAAVIAAFRASGLADHRASLVIKVHGASGNEKDLEKLKAAVADLPHTVLITQTLSRQDLYCLESACDCFVSLHRSEGFGLAIAECMYLGKPVIATDWSASSEYLNTSNGCPVSAALTVLDRNVGPYSQGQTWAEPDISHAAEWMERVYSNPELGASLGREAQRTVEQRFSPVVIGARYRKRLEAILIR